MDPIPTLKSATRRSRNPGRAATPMRQPGTLQDRIAARVDGIEPVIVPWDQRTITPQQAKREGLATSKQLAEIVGYSDNSLVRYAKKFDNFPEPKGRILTGHNGYPRAYSITEVKAWIQLMQRRRRINKPRTKKP